MLKKISSEKDDYFHRTYYDQGIVLNKINSNVIKSRYAYAELDNGKGLIARTIEGKLLLIDSKQKTTFVDSADIANDDFAITITGWNTSDILIYRKYNRSYFFHVKKKEKRLMAELDKCSFFWNERSQF